jgi:hypothetical protein
MTAGHKMSGDDADIILVSTIQTDPAYIELAKKRNSTTWIYLYTRKHPFDLRMSCRNRNFGGHYDSK